MSRPQERRRTDASSQVVRPAPEPGLRAPAIPTGPGDVDPGVQPLSRADRAADAALVEGLAVDDPGAAAAFVRRFQGPVFGLAVSIVRDGPLAEDVSQEVFVRAWRAAATYDIRRASVLTWIMTITRNAAIDATRMRRPMPTEDEVLDRLLMDTLIAPDAEESALRHLETDLAVERLHALPPAQARAVVLAVFGGCTAKEVGLREDIPLGTAKTRIRTGLLRLRAAIEREEP